MSGKFKEIRTRLGMTQKEFSDLLGIKQSYYSAIERGEKRASTTVVNSLISLGVPADWYYSGSDVELPELNINTKQYSHRSVVVDAPTNSANDISSNSDKTYEIADVLDAYKDNRISLQNIVNTFARASFERYKVKNNTNFAINSFSNIAETLKFVSEIFRILQMLMKKEIEEMNRKILLTDGAIDPDLQDEIIRKYNTVYDEYVSKYSDAVNDIAHLAISNNAELTKTIQQVLKNRES